LGKFSGDSRRVLGLFHALAIRLTFDLCGALRVVYAMLSEALLARQVDATAFQQSRLASFNADLLPAIILCAGLLPRAASVGGLQDLCESG
jgi:hypothetical protein